MWRIRSSWVVANGWCIMLVAALVPFELATRLYRILRKSYPGFAQEQHWDSSVGRRYDGRLAGQSVEVKTSVNGTVRMSPFHASQIARDALNRQKPLWVCYDANPSTGMIRALQTARMPWAVVWP